MVSVLGGRFGQVDMPGMRKQIGVVDPAHRLIDWLTAEEVVLTGATGTIRPLPDRYGAAERARAAALLARVGCAELSGRAIRSCSQGERQRVRIARALMPAPALLLLDEPAVGLDLPAREALIGALTALARDEPELGMVVVTHHLEELPPTVDYALLLREGEMVVAGGVATALTSETVLRSFGLSITVDRLDGRWTARGSAGWALPANGETAEPR
jgi:iron complex transport system ATP-binding protein